jgi:hypothetical protein
MLQAGGKKQMSQRGSGPIHRDDVDAIFQIPRNEAQRFHGTQNPKDTARGLAAQLGVADHNRRPGNHQRKIGEVFSQLPFRFRFTAGVGDQVSGMLTGKIVFVNKRLGRGALFRPMRGCAARIED